MKINIIMGFFLPVPALAGGATEKIWHHLARHFVKAGHEVTLISRRWPELPDHSTECEGKLVHLRLDGYDHTTKLSRNLWLDFKWGLRVARALPKADVTICNVVSLPAFLRWWRPRAGKVAVVLGRMPKGQNRVYGGVHHVLATSHAVATQVLAENPRLAPKLTIFPNPMDWAANAAVAAKTDVFTIGYIGRIHPEKGLEQLLDAGRILAANAGLPAWRITLTGPVTIAQGGGGEAYRDSLKSKYQADLGSRLEFHDPVYDQVKLARIFGGLDVFCYPSLAAKGEGLSIAPMEAMAARAVPVLSTLDCYRDLIIPGRNGFQFKEGLPDSPTELAEILQRLMLEPALREQVAAAAQETAKRHDYAASAQVVLAAITPKVPTP